MFLLSLVDNRTLFVCQCMLAIPFAAIFLWLSWAYPQLRGTRSVGLGFFAGVASTSLVLSRGFIPGLLSVTVANGFGLIAFLLFYDGVVRFVGARGRLWVLGAISTMSLAVVYYYSEVESHIVPRIVAIALSCGLIRVATAWELLQSDRIAAANGRGRLDGLGLDRRGMKPALRRGNSFFIVFVGLVGLWQMFRAVASAIGGAPENFMQRDLIQTLTIALNLVYVVVFGVCFLLMAGEEFLRRSQDESERDVLSGVWNRRGIEARLTEELKRSYRSHGRLCVALVDIDHFKRINDVYGHARGDAAIAGVAGALVKSLRAVDFVGRYGGDEFLLILPSLTGMHAAEVSRRLSEAVSGIPVTSAAEALTISVGITEAGPNDDLLSLIARADTALYEAKSAGRDCLRFVEAERTFADTIHNRTEPLVS